MQLIDGKVPLTDLARELEVTNVALLQHLKNQSGLGVGAVKLGGKATGPYLLPIDSVLNFLTWAKGKAKQMSMENILSTEEKIWQLKQQ